jgi:hypothetical protein
LAPVDDYKYNCGLTTHNGTRYLSYRYGYMMQSGTGICPIDDDFKAVGPSKIVSRQESRKEDMRLFTHQGVLCGSFTHAACDIVVRICQFNNDLTVKKEIDFKMKTGRWEKNWQFFEYNGRLLFVYSINPHKVYECDWDGNVKIISSVNFPNQWEINGTQLRGGTPPILFNGRYYSMFHTSDYRMGMYCFSAHPPFTILDISDAPIVDRSNGGVHFPCGLETINNGFVVTYGAGDKLAKHMKLTFKVTSPS